MKTNFFEELDKLMPNFNVKMGVTKKEGTISVIFALQPLSNSVDEKSIPELIISGTPEELDEEFLAKIQEPLLQAATAFDNIASFTKSVKKVEKEAEEKGKSKTTKKETPKVDSKREEAKSDPDETEGEEETKKETAKPEKKKVEAESLNAEGHIKKANDFYGKKSFAEALTHYEKALELTKDKKLKDVIKESISSCKVKIKAESELLGEDVGQVPGDEKEETPEEDEEESESDDDGEDEEDDDDSFNVDEL
jgi:PRTRC genetic system protein E